MIKIYGKDNCPFCVNAVKLCEQNGLVKDKDFFEYKIGKDCTKEELISKCPVAVRTVPQIFKGDQYIGGYTDLVKFFKEQ